jgi:hypothetical protein
VIRLGDLIDFNGKRWLVRKLERLTRSAIVIDVAGGLDSIENNLDETDPTACVVVGNPVQNWPYVAVPGSRRLGKLQEIRRPSLQLQAGFTVLAPFEDWLVSDALQIGGAIFFNPALNLRYGDVLVGVYQNGTTRIAIPKQYMSVTQRIAENEAAAAAREAPETPELPELPPELRPPRTVYDHLADENYDDDE